MKLTVHTFLTLDGVMQGPGGVEEDRSNGFDRGGWLIPFADQTFGEIVDSWFARTSAVLLGRNTFETMRTYWSQVTDENNAVAQTLNHGPKYVVSNTVTELDWGHTTVLADLDEVRALKEQDAEGELQVHGSAELAAALHDAGLVDEYRLLVFPVTVGAGKRLFGTGAPPVGFEVAETRVTSTGAQYCRLIPQTFTTGTATVENGKETY